MAPVDNVIMQLRELETDREREKNLLNKSVANTSARSLSHTGLPKSVCLVVMSAGSIRSVYQPLLTCLLISFSWLEPLLLNQSTLDVVTTSTLLRS